MYMLEEEEQWATVLIREIKIALIKTRSIIFDRNDSSSHSNPSSPTALLNCAETSASLSIADEVSALSFGTENNADDTTLIEGEESDPKSVKGAKPAQDTLRQVELATIFCDSLLRALADIVNGTRDILEDYLTIEQKQSLLQLVESHQSRQKQELLTVSQIKTNGPANDDKFHSKNIDSAKDAMNSAIDKLMNWLSAPWLIVPIDETPGSGNDVAVYTLSEDERSYFWKRNVTMIIGGSSI